MMRAREQRREPRIESLALIRRDRTPCSEPRPGRAFTLIELLVTVAVISLLIGLLLPALAGARTSAGAAGCAANQRQLLIGWSLYADDHAGRVMPLAYWRNDNMVDGRPVYWWGALGDGDAPPDHDNGFLGPYLQSTLHERSVYECPAQPWGTYRPQGPGRHPTSTYGYNGYYLSPAQTPGWGAIIGHRPWVRISRIELPTELFVFADSLMAGDPPSNNALLDPPMLFTGAGWERNAYPTTCFRHGPSAQSGRADGGVRPARADPRDLVHPDQRIGSAGRDNDPHYVPDWRAW